MKVKSIVRDGEDASFIERGRLDQDEEISAKELSAKKKGSRTSVVGGGKCKSSST